METNEQNQEVLASWEIAAYAHYERGPFWYVLAGIIGGGLLITAFVTANFLLAVVVVMVGFVMIVQNGAHPPAILVEITPAGIKRGSQFFPYSSIDHFWVVYDPPLKSLHFVVKRALYSTIHVPIDGQNPVELRAILKKYVRENMDRESEPVIDSIARILKI